VYLAGDGRHSRRGRTLSLVSSSRRLFVSFTFVCIICGGVSLVVYPSRIFPASSPARQYSEFPSVSDAYSIGASKIGDLWFLKLAKTIKYTYMNLVNALRVRYRG
jgi:hypothetical protein